MDHNEHGTPHDLARAVEALADRVDRLTRRIESLERGRALGDHAPTDPSPADPEASTAPPPPKRIPEHLTPSAPQSTPGPSDPAQSDTAKGGGYSPVRQTPKPTERVRAPERPASKRPKLQISTDSFEWLLGIKGLMLLGVVIVVVGVGMFLKLAHDEGWIAALSPWTKCGSAAAFGVALVALGEFLRRKINPLASSGFGAAGIATLYASVYAAARQYALIADETAFAIMFAVTAAGVLLGAVGGRVLLSLLSLVGAFAVPVLLRSGEPSFVLFPAYLLLLLTMGLVLSGWKGGRYALARQLAWWGTGVMGTLWLIDMHDRSAASSITFVSAAWLLTIIELACSARFFKVLRGSVAWDATSGAGFLVNDEGERVFNPGSLLSREARWVNALFGATLWAVTSAAITLRAHDPELVFLSPLGFAAASVMVLLAAWRSGALPSFTPERGDASPLTLYLAALTINTGVLVAAAIATGLGGWIEVLAWLLVGLAAVETSRVLRFRAVGVFGGAMLLFALGRLMSYDLMRAIDTVPAYETLGLAAGPWNAQLLAAAAVFLLASWRTRYTIERHTAAVLGLWALAWSVLHTSAEPGPIGVVWAFIAVGSAWTLLRAGPSLRRTIRINTLVMLSIGTLIGVMGSMPEGDPIEPVKLVLLAAAWVAYAALPGAAYATRVAGATAAVGVSLLALGAVEESHGLEVMYACDALVLLALVALGKPLWRWSLTELAAVLLPWFAIVLALNAARVGGEYLDRAPLIGADSVASFILVLTLGYAARALPGRAIPDDAPAELTKVSQISRRVLLVTLWFALLGVSTVEVVRVLYELTDSGSAQGAGVSIWWSVFAVGSVVLGFRYPKPLRWSGLTLLCVVAAKVLIFDTTTLEPTARIVASITVGLIIIATGVLYTVLVKKLEQDAPSDTATAEADRE